METCEMCGDPHLFEAHTYHLVSGSEIVGLTVDLQNCSYHGARAGAMARLQFQLINHFPNKKFNFLPGKMAPEGTNGQMSVVSFVGYEVLNPDEWTRAPYLGI